VHAWINGDYGTAESALDSLKKCYQAELLYGDHLVGEFIKQLKNEGLFENTILVITSDHGEMFGEHGQLNHGMTTWEDIFRVPCIIHYPGHPDMGRDFKYLTSNLDLLPSLFDLIGEAAYPHDKTKLDGVSFMDQSIDWENRQLVVDAPPLVLPERLKAYPKVIAKGSVFFRAVRNSRYKYIWLSNGQRFLFPVGVDEEPANSILETEPEIAQRMHDQMLAYYKNIDPDFKIELYPINMGTSAAMKMTNPVIRQELKKLGYW
jgi:arylsulfatase A-like enzyme